MILMVVAFACEGVSDAMSAEKGQSGPPAPIWMRDVKLFDSPPERLTILGAKRDGKFVPTSVILPPRPGTTAPSVSLPLQVNLVPRLDFRSFGAEERVTVARDGEVVTVRCKPGHRPAGALLSAPGFHFPRGLQGAMRVEVEATGSFQAAVAEKGQQAANLVALSGAASSMVKAVMPSNAWASLRSPAELVILCPAVAGKLSINRIEIDPAPREAEKPVGTWIWNVTKWLGRADQLIAELRRFAIGEVFIQVQIAKGEIVERAALVRLIEDLSAAGIGVNTVEGDGAMAGPQGRIGALERARLLARLKTQTGGKILSFQYDIEPYVLPEFESDPDFWWTGLGRTYTELAGILQEPVSAVVPFWLLRHKAAEAALLRARPSLARIVVMSYRTAAGDVEEIAEEWLEWGRRNAVPVAFALENGFVPTEYAQYYLRAETGNLLLEVSGGKGRVVLFAEPALGTGERLAYSLKAESQIDSARISFLGDRNKLTKVRGRLQSSLSAWEMFDGLLIHEMLPLE